MMRTHDGLNLHTKAWTIPDAKADILLAHGFFEHCERYDGEAAFLNHAGYSVYSYDQRTHGRSEGKRRSYISDFKAYSEDYKQYLDQLALGKDRPYFLLAHSMGGLVQVTHLIEHSSITDSNFKGALFTAPFIMPDRNTAPALQKIASIVGTLLPTLKVIEIDSNAISRDPDEIRKYNTDPLIYTDKMYAASGYHLIKQTKKIRPQLHKVTCPILILHGTDDKLAEIEGSRRLYADAASTDKELVELQDYKHEITKDIGKEKVLTMLKDWMDARI
jgi:alpha-beta hydrolase superfamily lysophospholipase